MPLARAAFSNMIKFSSSIESFTKLIEDVERANTEIGDAEQGDQKWRSIANQIKGTGDDNYFSLLGKWEQASQMRQWTQQVKQKLSDKISVDIEN